MKDSESFLLLSQEGYLIRSCLTSGLTELRKANVHHKGCFYSALFNLSIGIERLLKVIIIVDYMLENKLDVPSSKDLKKYGHNILELYDSSVKIADKRGIKITGFLSLDAINQDLLTLLNNFATTTRYHNLDTLSEKKNNQDPLEHWNNIIQEVIFKDVSDKQRKKILNQAGYVAEKIKDITICFNYGLDKKPLTLEESIGLPSLHELSVKYIILRLVNILCPFRDLIDDLCIQSYSINSITPVIPQLQEFLDFLWNDRKYVLAKKKWT
jgi:hypothetical protein